MHLVENRTINNLSLITLPITQYILYNQMGYYNALLVHNIFLIEWVKPYQTPIILIIHYI